MMQRSTDAELAEHRMCRQSENRAGKTADVTDTHQTHAHTYRCQTRPPYKKITHAYTNSLLDGPKHDN